MVVGDGPVGVVLIGPAEFEGTRVGPDVVDEAGVVADTDCTAGEAPAPVVGEEVVGPAVMPPGAGPLIPATAGPPGDEEVAVPGAEVPAPPGVPPADEAGAEEVSAAGRSMVGAMPARDRSGLDDDPPPDGAETEPLVAALLGDAAPAWDAFPSGEPAERLLAEDSPLV